MDNSTWQRAAAIFDIVFDLGRAARLDELDRQCGDDAVLRAEVEQLLRAANAHADFEDSLYASRDLLACDWNDERDVELGIAPGVKIGPWVVVREIGRGGMGIVVLADRVEGDFEQRVAIKVLPYPTPGLLQRFRRERRILARLDHVHIARLLDGGLTTLHIPYFVMEYVDGAPITTYCKEHKLTLRERLKLFMTVCEAVRFAHRALVVHRDIKPSNILVTPDGVTKLLDFGIAKIMAIRDDDGGDLTEAALFTPDYAAPEQIRGEAVTTATDVYSLGAVLYELLTETRYCGRVESGLITRDSATVPPSSILSRDSELFKARKEIRGDLDRVVMKCLESDIEKRYSSAQELHQDLSNFIRGRAVSATADAWPYRLRKFILRHRLTMAGSLFVILIGAIGAAAVAWEAREAARQEQSAMQASMLAQRAADVRALTMNMLTDVLRSSSPQDASTHVNSVGAAVDASSARALANLKTDPQHQTVIISVLASSYLQLNHPQQALELVESALALIAPQPESANADLLELYLEMARAAAEVGAIEKSYDAISRAEKIMNLPHMASNVGRISTELARLEIALHIGRPEEAHDIAQRLLHEANTPELRDTLEFADVLRVNASFMTDSTVALKLMKQAYAIVAAHYGPSSPVSMDLERLVLWTDDSRALDADQILDRHELLLKELFGEQSSDLADVYELRCRRARDDHDEERAESNCRKAIEMLERTEEPQSLRLANAYDNEGDLLLKTDPTKALDYFERELAVRRSTFSEKVINVVHARLRIADAHCRQGYVDQALSEFDEAIADYIIRINPGDNFESAYAASFSQCLVDQGRPAEARRELQIHANPEQAHPALDEIDRQHVKDAWQRVQKFDALEDVSR